MPALGKLSLLFRWKPTGPAVVIYSVSICAAAPLPLLDPHFLEVIR
jgi:hypothetical protein